MRGVRRVVFSVILCAVGFSAIQAAAQTLTDPPKPEPRAFAVGIGADVVSAFVWRGFINSDVPCVQPTAWVRLGPVTVSSWMNLEHLERARFDFVEHDLTVEYRRDVGGVGVTVGWINYFFRRPETGRHTNEFYGGLQFGGPLEPQVMVFVDPQEGNGTYVSLGISHAFPLGGHRLSLTPAATVGYNHHQWMDGSGVSDLNLSLTASVPVGRMTLEPFAGYSIGASRLGLPRKFYLGVTVSAE